MKQFFLISPLKLGLHFLRLLTTEMIIYYCLLIERIYTTSYFMYLITENFQNYMAYCIIHIVLMP